MSRASSFASFVRRLPGFLREGLTLQAARAEVRRGLDEREERFIALAARTIYEHARSPYVPLLRHAGCELGDLSASVKRNGLEPTLVELRRSGVYVSFEEFKGREPIVRGDLVVHARSADFDNPLLGAGYRTQTSGSTGVSTQSWVSLDYLGPRAISTVLAMSAFGVIGEPSVMWRESLPAPTIGLILEDAKAGHRHERWFAPPLKRSLRSAAAGRVATELIVRAGARGGVRLPRPEPLGYENAVVVVRWAERRLAERGVCLIRAGVSNALRVANAAEEAGVDLTGATLLGGGEPMTEAKARAIGRSGARWMPGYAIGEVGRVGIGCADPADPSDVHYLKHAVAMITHPRLVPGSQQTVDAFNFTLLLAGSPKVLLNTELDDYGVIEERRCGCPIEEAGLTQHIRQIFSYRKLTGEGVTLVGSDMLRLLEDVLPRRFGGSSVDYQLVEEEDDRGFTKLVLLVSPRLNLDDEAEVVDTLLRELGDSSLARDIRSIWGRAGSIVVRREEPAVTLGGKVRPLVSRRESV